MDSPVDPSKLAGLVKSLNESLDTVRTRLAMATATVVFGLLIEYEADARKVLSALLHGVRHTNWNAFRSLERHVKRSVLGGILITVGVGAELFYEHRTSFMEGELQFANGQIVASLNRKAQDAERDTQALKTEAETARAKAAQDELQTAKAQLELARIQSKLKDRHLDALQQEHFIRALSRFHGETATFATFTAPPETVAFTRELKELLTTGAHWQVKDGSSMLGSGNPEDEGVVVAVLSPPFPESGKALVVALGRAGIVAHLKTGWFARELKGLVIIVGSKP